MPWPPPLRPASPHREMLRCVARTALRTKLYEKLADQLTDIVVDAVLTIKKPDQPLDLYMVGAGRTGMGVLCGCRVPVWVMHGSWVQCIIGVRWCWIGVG